MGWGRAEKSASLRNCCWALIDTCVRSRALLGICAPWTGGPCALEAASVGEGLPSTGNFAPFQKLRKIFDFVLPIVPVDGSDDTAHLLLTRAHMLSARFGNRFLDMTWQIAMTEAFNKAFLMARLGNRLEDVVMPAGFCFELCPIRPFCKAVFHVWRPGHCAAAALSCAAASAALEAFAAVVTLRIAFLTLRDAALWNCQCTGAAFFCPY